MRTQFKLVLATIFLTAVIWIFADLTSQKTYDTDIAVRLVAPPDIALQLENHKADDPNVTLVRVTLRGPNATIRKRKLQESAGADPLELVIELNSDLKPGIIQSRNILPDITHLSAIRDIGLYVGEVHQPTIEFTVARYKYVELEVVVDPGEYSISGEAKIDPEKVQARILESDYGRLAGRLEHVTVPLEKKDMRTNSGQQVSIFDITLRPQWLDVEVDAQFNPKSIKVEVKIEQKYVENSISLIPVNVSATPDVFSKYDIRFLEGLLKTEKIDVKGPSEKVSDLTAKKIYAFVKIEEADQPADEDEVDRRKQVKFSFPPGYEDVVITSPEITVNVILKKRPSTEKPAAE